MVAMAAAMASSLEAQATHLGALIRGAGGLRRATTRSRMASREGVDDPTHAHRV